MASSSNPDHAPAPPPALQLRGTAPGSTHSLVNGLRALSKRGVASSDSAPRLSLSLPAGSAPLLGNALVVAAQLFAALQFTLEEKFLGSYRMQVGAAVRVHSLACALEELPACTHIMAAPFLAAPAGCWHRGSLGNAAVFGPAAAAVVPAGAQRAASRGSGRSAERHSSDPEPQERCKWILWGCGACAPAMC